MSELKTNVISKQGVRMLSMDFLDVVQQAAIAAYPWKGKGNKIQADDAGTEAMRNRLNRIDMKASIVIGEGEMDEAPMLYIGERVGTGFGPEIDIAVDPVDGTTALSKGKNNSIAVIAAAVGGSLLHAPDMYMKKLAVGPKAKGAIDINLSLTENMYSVAEALGKDVKELTVMIQDRPRHDHFVKEVLELGASVRLFTDGDITSSLTTAIDGIDVDILVGTGGAPEGVIAATALKCLGGDFQGKLAPQNKAEIDRCIKMGIPNPDKVLTLDDIVRSDECLFAAAAISDEHIMKGVRKQENGLIVTQSFLAIGGNNSKLQFIESYHEG
ncbi:class II fructose-bisphosphatase [Oceanobacillus damuensis]|uniref:class II fructose-bisphosphatase n=1 Tax=Oceanobacillus damuensis TaxID=937928 RepID=UPI00082BF8EB|nr:class II fructose-bisphosphatase [Oceanobacillus damuensis]